MRSLLAEAIATFVLDLEWACLRLDSFVRSGKLFTASARLGAGVVGRVRARQRTEVADAVVRIVRGDA